MHGRVHRFIILLLFSFAISAAQSRQQSNNLPVAESGPADRSHTTLRLIADVQAIQPGGEFTAGLLMSMDEGWHTYWKNPGEAGLPPQITWTLPEGMTVGEIQWPVPHKYTEGGEVLTYGYEKENMLLVGMKAPSTLKVGSSVILRADVNWLECERVCIPGHGKAILTMPVTRGPMANDNGALFEKYRMRLPRAFPRSPDISLKTETRLSTVILSLTTTKKFVVRQDNLPDFYPEAIEDIVIGRTKLVATDREATLRVPLSVYEKISEPRTLRGVLVYELSSGDRQAVEVEIPLSAEFCASLSLEGQAGGSVLERTFETVQTGEAALPLYVYILFAVIGGLLLNIMPCVLPVIALKIFGLVKMAGNEPQRVKKLGWAFSFGILASFIALALVVILVQAAGEQVGWGFQFQEPLFVIVMSAVVFAFGLSLFGVYEIQLPGFAIAGVGTLLTKEPQSGNGYTSSFAEGVFATILATPCTAPFLGTALGFAFSQHPLMIILIFASVAFGMVLPYVLLTMKPSWTKFLPKPGEWMVTAKQFMGFLMMATLLWLLYILGKQLGMEAVIWTSAFLLLLGVACWLIGRFAILNASRRQQAITWALALVLIVGGYWGFLESILDVRNIVAGTRPTSTQSDAHGIQWQAFSLEKLDADLRDNKAVFIDFTADWCLTCKVNEQTVMTDREVVEKFKSRDIVPIRADWTNRNPDITRLLAKFGRIGVPLYVVFPAGKPTEPIVLPEVITTGIVIDAIERATDGTTANTLR